MTTVSEQEGWKNKVNRLKEDLEAANFKDTLSVTDFDSFNGALQHLFRRYSRYPVAKFVNERLAPHFEHIKSFEKAISISAQQSANCSYVWSASLAIIEVRNRLAARPSSSQNDQVRPRTTKLSVLTPVHLPPCQSHAGHFRPTGKILLEFSNV